jgi:hypothetical protein
MADLRLDALLGGAYNDAGAETDAPEIYKTDTEHTDRTEYLCIDKDVLAEYDAILEEIQADILRGELPQGILLKAIRCLCLIRCPKGYFEKADTSLRALYGAELTLDEMGAKEGIEFLKFLRGNVENDLEVERAYNILKAHRQPQKIRDALKMADKLQGAEIKRLEAESGYTE